VYPSWILLLETLQKEERAGGNSRHVEHQGGGALPDYSNSVYTDKKEKKIFLIYKEIQNGALQSNI
jgi:hypothetical protein